MPTAREPHELAYPLVKYPSRDGWSHRDVLRLVHTVEELHGDAEPGPSGEYEPFAGSRRRAAVPDRQRARTMYRVHDRTAEPERTPAGDYYVVVSEYRTFYVTPETAARVGRELERRWWGSRWLKFTDVSGSRVWVLRAQVQAVMESTERQRERDRFFFRAMRREEDAAEQEWGED